ncbi:diguanylate cyclase domain-containing protein [Williamsia sp. MIQD14]|uniref:GGDEF domain-containing protein n=1 Tax=Williamsia sp. MIQD14 TaxID=3425703 RepID=UPI003DA1042C
MAVVPPPHPPGPGAARIRDKSTGELLRWWWEQPFEYEWVHAFAESRAWLRVDRLLVAVGFALFAVVGIVLIATGRPGTVVNVSTAIAVVVFASSAWWWRSHRPWPGERVSLGFVVVGELAGVALAAAAPSPTAALALMSLYVLPGIYLMFIHSPVILIGHCVWVTAVIAGTGTYALVATDIDTVTAIVVMVTQFAACNGGLIAGQIALTFLRNDARNSFTDPLTGLLNRRGFEEAVSHSTTRVRTGEPVSVLMADIDKFKSINDTNGHSHGDALLVAVAQALSAVCDGHADAIARIGGDEFVAILHVGAEPASALAHRVRAMMADSSRSEPVTMSIGVHTTLPSTWPPPEHEIGEMMARADAVLYSTKRGGGDAVTAAHDPAP